MLALKVKGWRYENIRGGVRNLGIDLDDDPRWTLIQMPNGTGKTTTMMLLRAALTGEAPTPEEIRGLRADDETQAGAFELRLEIGDAAYRIELQFDFERGACTFFTTRAQVRGGGREPGWHLPTVLKRLLTPEFTRLFVFDGEFAKDIRSQDKDRTTTSIRTLYRLDQLDGLRRDIKALVDDEIARASDVSKAKEQKGITRLSNAVDEAKTVLNGLIKKQSDLKAEKSSKTSRLEIVKQAVLARTAENEQFRTRRLALDTQLEELNTKITSLTTGGLEAVRSPTRVSLVLLTKLRSLGERLTTLQLPKTISVEFFHELANAKDCVCDRPIGPVEKAAIIAGADRFLAEDQITVINRMKMAVREAAATGSEFADIAGDLRIQLRERRSVEQQIDQLQQDQVEGGDEELAELLKEQAELSDRLGRLDEELRVLETTEKQFGAPYSWVQNLAACRAELKQRQHRLAVATNTYNFQTAADRLKAIIDTVATSALEGLREKVRLATNDKLSRLAISERLRVSRIGSALELASDDTSSKGGVSEGQSLAVAYAFLTSLLSAAPYRLPFIVDSPAVSLDVAVRREVGDVIPTLFDQMIMFVISSERDGFADAFYPRQDVRYLTIGPTGPEDEIRLTEGLEAFRTFHNRPVKEAAAQ